MDADGSHEGARLSGLIAKQYQVERPLGSGGMGTVYLAQDTRLKRPVAIKAILDDRESDPVVRERFERETRVASRINHPYVATVYDVVEHDGRLLLVMEYLTGRSLRDVLADGPPPQHLAARWLLEIAEALAAIHAAGIVHRDIKPGNVMITESGHVKVTDFGLARRTVEHLPDATTMTEQASLTGMGTALGTLMYMSPEQLRGEPADTRSDQFSLGVLAWETLTGAHPFARESTAQSISAILNEQPRVRSATLDAAPSAAVHTVVLRMLAKEPDERFESTDRLVTELRSVVRATEPERTVTPATLGLWLRLAAVFVLAVVVLGAAGMWWLRQPPTWDGARYVVSVAPFRSPADDEEAVLQAAMVTDLLTQDLQASYLIRAEGPEELQLAGLSPLKTLNELGVRVSAARDTDYVLLGSVERKGDGWVATASIRPAREGRAEPPPLEVSGDGALALAEGLAAGVRRRLPDVSRLTALRDDRVDLTELTSALPEALAAYERGALAMREGRVVAAVVAFEQAVAVDQGFALAQARLAEALHEVGYGRRARTTADRARDLAPQKPTDLAQQRLKLTVQGVRGQVFGDNESWLDATARLLEAFPDEPALMLEHARALTADQQYEEALHLLGRALQIDARNPLLRHEIAIALLSLDRLDESHQTLREVRPLFELLESDEGLAWVERTHGFIDQERDSYAEAIEHFENAATLYSGAGRPVSAADAELASQGARLERGDFAGAEAGIESALRIGSEVGNLKLQARALISRGVLQTYRQDWDGSVRYYLQAADLGRQLENGELMVMPLANAGGLLVWLRRLDEARPVLEEARVIAEELGQQDLMLAMGTTEADLLVQTGDVDRAIELYDRLLGDSGDRMEAALLSPAMAYAYLHYERARFDQALDMLDRVIRDSRALDRPMDIGRALQNRSRVYSALGRVEAAEVDATELAAIAADYPDLQSAEGMVRTLRRLHRGEWEAVLAAPTSRPGHTGIGGVLMRCAALYHTGQVDEAVEVCGLVPTMDGNVPIDETRARAWRALALADAGRFAETVTDAVAARDEARRMGLLLTEARAAAAIASIPETNRPAGWPEVLREGVAALDAAQAAAPEQDRSTLTARPDVAHVLARLEAAGAR